MQNFLFKHFTVPKILCNNKKKEEIMEQEIIIGKIYKHYKGNLYKVIDFATHSETMEEMIVYQPLKTGATWVRPKSMWNEIVDDKGTLRFTLQ